MRILIWGTLLQVATLIFAPSIGSASQLRSISLTSDQVFSAPRWMYDEVTVNGPAIVQQMVEIRRHQIKHEAVACEAAARRASQDNKGVENWVATVRLQCATEAAKADSKQGPALGSALKTINDRPRWLLWGPQVDSLRKAWIDGELVWFELQIRGSRKAAWETYDLLQQAKNWLTPEQRAQCLRTAGELAFVEQNLLVAMDLFSRSLSEKDSSDVRKRIEALKGAIASKKAGEKDLVPPASPAAGAVAFTGDEQKLVNRMHQALENGDLLSVVEDGIEVVNEFPGSDAAKWSVDRILEIYLSLGAHTESNYDRLREKAVDLMVKADAARSYRWAQNAFAKGFYADAYRLADASAEKIGSQPDATKIIDLAAQSAWQSGNAGRAETLFRKLVGQHAGSDESKQALFRLGLIKFRDKKWADASAYFERLLALGSIGDLEYSALHWHWRSQQQLKAKTADEVAGRLMAKYPLTYYGLRARAELNRGILTWPKANVAASKTDLWLSESQSQAWERFQLLLKAGWFEEAQAELTTLPVPESAEEKVVRGRMLAAAFDHYRAIKMLNEAWQKRPELQQLDLLRTAFPSEFLGTVKNESRSASLDPQVVMGLIRQESSFRTGVTSPAGAVGVMQILPSTALDVASGQKFKTDLTDLDSLKRPDLNIKVGALYLSRLLKAYGGHLPLALAAYNAGPGRIKRWLSARADLAGLESRLSSDPLDEIWIDELPWDETNFYVKSVLRNLLMYRLLDAGEVAMTNPLWLTPKK